MKWRTKPGDKGSASSGDEIDAFKWTADIPSPTYPDWVFDEIEAGKISLANAGTPQVSMTFQTADGIMVARPGDWIIRGADGEIYPAKASHFENNYEIAA